MSDNSAYQRSVREPDSASAVAAAAGVAAPAARRALEKATTEREQRAQLELFRYLVPVALMAAGTDMLLSILNRAEGDAWVTPMVESNAVAVLALLLSAVVFRIGGLVPGKAVYYIAVAGAFAGHAFWVGYALSTPGLAFLALLIIQEALGPREGNLLKGLTIAALMLVASIGLSQLAGLIPVTVVPMHHQLVVTAALFISAFLLGRAALTSRATILRQGMDATIEQINLNESLNVALNARNSFFSAVSHEMRTPLHGINSALALVNHPRATAEAKQRYLQTIDKSVSDLGKIIDDVLDLSRLESGGFKLEATEVDLKALCARQIELFRPAAEANGTALSLDLDFDEASAMKADGLRLRQMLSNLLSNAIKFTSNGVVTLSVKVEAQRGRTARWRFSVTDTGVGLDADSQARLFKPFVQAGNQPEGGNTGSGLGLSIVAGLARQMNGEVGVSSQPGAGSTFWFTIELDTVQGADPSSQPAELELR